MDNDLIHELILEYAAEATFVPTQGAYPGTAWAGAIKRGARRYAIEYFQRFGLLPRGKHMVKPWGKWWARQGSNLRPLPCEGSANAALRMLCPCLIGF